MDWKAELADPERKIRVVCAYCGSVIKDGVPPVSSGMCLDCAERWYDMEGIKT